jgi:hypothetical protein
MLFVATKWHRELWNKKTARTRKMSRRFRTRSAGSSRRLSPAPSPAPAQQGEQAQSNRHGGPPDRSTGRPVCNRRGNAPVGNGDCSRFRKSSATCGGNDEAAAIKVIKNHDRENILGHVRTRPLSAALVRRGNRRRKVGLSQEEIE